MNYFLIVNPTSGRGMGEKSIPAIEQSLREAGISYTLQRTQRPWQAAELAEQAARDGYEVVVSAGGDGTLNEVINGLMRAKKSGFTQTALAVLAIGTGNDFAGGMGIPSQFEKSIQTLIANRRKKIDVGWLQSEEFPEGRYFGNGVGIGFDAAVGFAALQLRWLRGMPAYLVGVVQTVFFYYKPPLLKISLDGKTLQQRSLMVSIMNGNRMGGGFRMTPNSKPDDGMFDLCIAATAGKLRIFQLLPRFISGTQEGQPEIRMERAKRVEITALEGNFPAHADGETLCTAGKTIRLEIVPAALELLAP
jgi:YegS/Rv2252/BmrU family lipid kinase